MDSDTQLGILVQFGTILVFLRKPDTDLVLQSSELTPEPYSLESDT